MASVGFVLLCVLGLYISDVVGSEESFEGGSGDNEHEDSADILGGKETLGDDGNVRDVVDEFLSFVEQYERNKENCTPGVSFNLGEGVITQYGVIRFRQQAELAVNRANFLTRIWKSASENMLTQSEYFFYTQVRSMVEGDKDVFAAGNCYDYMEFNNFTLYCPFAYRMPNNTIMVKDLSVEYKYLGNDSEFFFIPRMNAERKLSGKYNETKGE